ncbi:MAG: hypothetical protein CEE38_07415 [Planctomycetes bacterium B3_Pla]|nr:MAG: hypothetical protein CEE38_07415 [Planctomycetes bacterium B3_Pla]
MENISTARLNPTVLVCGAVLICVLCFGGCSNPAASDSNVSSVPDKAEHDFQVQADRPPTAKTLWAMADVLAAQGRDAECEFVLKRIINEYPEFAPAYNSLAELQMRRQRTDTAIKTLDSALDINPEDPVVLNNLGMCRIVLGEYENALKMFTRAAGVAPENARYRANMAVAMGLLGRYEEALALFKQVVPEDQAKHNLNVLREAEGAAKPAPATTSETPDLQEASK